MSAAQRRGQAPVRRVDLVHRLGAAAFGFGLSIFGILGFTAQLAFLSTSGHQVAGLSSNGALSTVSVAVGALLIAAAVRGGRTASTTTSAVGVLFVISGLVNLLLLGTKANLLAFELANVVFSIVAGLGLLVLGTFGRVSGHLPADNPYYLQRHQRDPSPGGVDSASPRSEQERRIDEEMAAAERALVQGTATGEQADRVQATDRHRRHEDRRHAWERFGPETPAAARNRDGHRPGDTGQGETRRKA